MLALELIDDDRAFARKIHQRFLQKPGSAHIASETSLQYIAACLRVLQPAHVLELGAGIGTVTEAVLTHAFQVRKLVSTETDDFCLKALQENLSNPNDARWTVVTDPSQLAALRFQADLIIGDGGFYSNEEMRAAHAGTVFLAEGNRSKLRGLFSKALAGTAQAVVFRQFGASRKFAVVKHDVLGFSIPLIRRVKKKGCWIGQVESTSRT